MAGSRANFTPTEEVIVEILNRMFAHFHHVITSRQSPKYSGDVANFQLKLFLAHLIFLFLKSLDAAVFGLGNFLTFSKRVFTLQNHVVPVLSKLVILRRHFYADKPTIHLMRHQS